MCLKVATKKLTAKTDLLVFKCLDYNKRKRTYCTPFRYLPIKFDKDRKCVIKSGDNALAIEKEWNNGNGVHRMIDVINIGVHAYTTKEQAEWVASKFWETKYYYAVIPKGCHYYIGFDFEVVTTELIVFKFKKDFYEYAKEHEIKEI